MAPRVKAIPDDELIAAMTRPTRTGPEEETTDSSSTGPAAASKGSGNSSNNHHHDSNQDVDIDVVQDSNDTGASTSTSSTSDGATAQSHKNAPGGDSVTKKSSATVEEPEEVRASNRIITERFFYSQLIVPFLR